jgi:hypothetical protein
MKLLGFQIPNYTFPGVAKDKLFDHVAMLTNTAERAGFDPHMEDPEAIALAGETLAGLRQPAAAH